jgi:hypothetical protein
MWVVMICFQCSSSVPEGPNVYGNKAPIDLPEPEETNGLLGKAWRSPASTLSPTRSINICRCCGQGYLWLNSSETFSQVLAVRAVDDHPRDPLTVKGGIAEHHFRPCSVCSKDAGRAPR